MKEKNKVAIIIIVFNISNLIALQINLIKKYCMDDFDIIVIDNSNDLNISHEVRREVYNLNCEYIKTNSETDFSRSHGTACNFAYNELSSRYNYMLFLDHDNFPISKFSVKEILTNKIIGGVGQGKFDSVTNMHRYYYWPGCVMLDNSKIEPNLVDFYVNSELGLDTGGNLYKVIEKYGQNQCANFDQGDVYNPFNNTIYNIIYSDKFSKEKFSFMHFINGSNWNNKSDNNQRINSLIEILKKLTN